MSSDSPAITGDLVRQHNLAPEEYERLKAILGREPSYTELGIFSVMWSEHCSYKNSRPLLKTFPTRSPRILVGAGEENAGIIDIGDGLAIAFKIESHNHPSAVEPFQGAATGVGGIIRDIFTMGARPVCAINSLRFGSIAENVKPGADLAESEVQGSKFKVQGSRFGAVPTLDPRPLGAPEGSAGGSTLAHNRRLFAGVVAGIAHYGNCFGIPTIAGEVAFDPCYEGNPLVNAFCLGVLRHDQIVRGAAKGVGNPVFYVGPATGRDGLAGAAFASQDLTQESAQQQRGAVQVGDPFMEKLVCEACLELLATGAVAGIQDMGAAGLTCSTCETAARAGNGIEIDLSRVPQRAPNMSPYEIMLSESQERMLIIVQKGREDDVKRIFDKWDLPWAEIGRVTDTGRMLVRNNGSVVADIPAKKLADEAPLYQREAREPEYIKSVREFTLASIPDQKDPVAALFSLLAWPTVASKNWVYRQYDHMVRDGTAVCPGSDAAVLRIKADSLPASAAQTEHTTRNTEAEGSGFRVQETGNRGQRTESGQASPEKLLALTVDGNATYVYLDPYEGSKIVVAEAARNLACSGAVPLGVTDNLNFGNPYNPEIFWQLRESVRGLAEACRVFNAPVTGGNVSLYNQSPAGPIDPTPTVAMVGLIERGEHITTQWFKDEGDAIILLGQAVDESDPLQGLGGSAYLQVMHGLKTGAPPRCDLEKEKDLHLVLRSLIHTGVVKSAHDCSDGGLAIALAECCISHQIARDTPRLIGAQLDLGARTALSARTLGESAAPTNETPAAVVRLDALFFGETQSRIIISTAPLDAVKTVERAKLLGVQAAWIGIVGGEDLEMHTDSGAFKWPVADLYDRWWNAIARAMG
ncbi:MAG: phosphoribosylformylglycinamidine synthase subunit PurL [Verrucomicrobia bacterium]|nr:MAG: phosphoribosylformylglycinamidine synthase subunit PurL [Verrucomicrobiota bacterium]